MNLRFGFGLRLQIVFGLCTVFLASFPLLGVVAVQLAQRARARDRLDCGRLLAAMLADEAKRNPAQLEEMAQRAIASGLIEGFEYAGPSAPPIRLGTQTHGSPVVHGRSAEDGLLEDGTLDEGLLEDGLPEDVLPEDSGAERGFGLPVAPQVKVWVAMPTSDAQKAFAKLLLLYVSVTAAAILLLVYTLLTYLIVRPVEGLTQASERLARGRLGADVPVRGAAEISRLALAFNAMAHQLRAEKRQLEGRLKDLEKTTSELESTQAQLVRSEKLAAVGRLSAGVAHEIGNPLAAILGLLELVRGDALDSKKRDEFLSRIQGETERIHRTIGDLLDFSRREPEEPDASCDLSKAIDDAIRLVKPQPASQKIEFVMPSTECAPVRGSESKMVQIFLNLLLNAADAVRGEGRIEIQIDALALGPSVQVLDDGPGFDTAILEQVFEPFVTSKPTGQGTGLGMAICHNLVEQCEGRIAATNRPSGGACISLQFRWAERSEEGASKDAS
ncbi:MAG: HAMP domain-containing sensor histidine kinase [Myxococcota bacterium]